MDPKNIVSDLKSLKKEHMVSEVKTAFNVALFKKDVMATVSNDALKTKFGYYFIVIGAVLGMIGMQLFGGWLKPSIINGLISAVIQAAAGVAGIYLASFVAKKFFKGAATHDQFFRVAAYAMILSWASVIPAVGMITGIWGLALFFVVLVTIHKLTTGGAIGTILVTGLIAWVTMAVLAFTGLTSLGSGFGGGHSSSNYGFNFGSGKDSGSIDFSNGGMKIKTSEGEINFDIPNVK